MGRARQVDPVDLTELFGDDARPRPLGKPRPAKKPNRIRRRAPREARNEKREAKALLGNLHSEFKLKQEVAQSSY
ncbi:hypothetical protein Tco_0903950 [Tanacetum coccineum]